jgi:hypothetical protein
MADTGGGDRGAINHLVYLRCGRKDESERDR